MDTRTFLTSILPAEGIYLIAVATAKGFRHKAFNSLEAAAEFAEDCDRQGVTVYHACAAFLKAPYKTEDGKYISRGQVNWRAAKAFWLDIDCGEGKAAEGHGYRTQAEAAKTIIGWSRSHGFPDPMLVNSGRGVHVYWCLSSEITPNEWVPVAEGLKALLAKDGILADPTRTADFSSVLRPVGTYNRKDPEHPLAVKVAYPQPAPIDTADFLAKVREEAGASAFDLSQMPGFMADDGASSPMPDNLYDNVVSSAGLIAEKCKQVKLMADTLGDVSYEHWRGVVGLLKHCDEGIELARAWSAKRAETGHQQTDVDTRYNTWDSPPTTCTFFEKCNPAGCANCPFHGKIKTPWSLGVKEPERKAETVEVTQEVDGEQKTVQYQIPPLPQGYQWNGSQLVRYIKTSNDLLEPHPFCNTQFYLVRRLRDSKGESLLTARAHFPRGEVREFEIPGSLIGAGGSKLMEHLGQFEIMAGNAMDAQKNMGAYLKSAVADLVGNVDAINTYSHFGWQEDNSSFLIGTRLYTKDGNVTEVLTSGGASEHAKVFPPPTGSVESYAAKINNIYNREGMEPLQYAICSLWAAPLVALCDSMYNGIPCVLSGTSSGKGKTTAVIAALMAYGRAMPGMAFSGREGATANAQASFLGTLRNLPVVFDEVTNKSARELSDLCYSLSSGVEKMRLRATTRNGVGFNERNEWRTHTALTGNAQITTRLATNGDTEAEVMRIFEINVDQYPIPKLDPLAVMTQVSSLDEDVGAAGDVFIRYVVQHKADVRTMIADTFGDLKADSDLMIQPRYRFYRNHMVCTLTAAKIMQSLGVHSFDIPKLTTFALRAVRDLFTKTADANSLSAKDAIAAILNKYSACIINTPTYNVKKGEARYDVGRINGEIAGRCIRSTPGNMDKQYNNQLFLSVKVIRDWCNENRMSMDYLSSALMHGGVLLEMRFRASLGKDTNIITTQCRCWRIDLTALDNMKDDKDE